MTGWPLGAVVVGMLAVTAFVFYWGGVGAAERRMARRLREAAEAVTGLKGGLIAAHVDAVNWRDRVELEPYELDAWYELTAQDEAA